MASIHHDQHLHWRHNGNPRSHLSPMPPFRSVSYPPPVPHMTRNSSLWLDELHEKASNRSQVSMGTSLSAERPLSEASDASRLSSYSKADSMTSVGSPTNLTPMSSIPTSDTARPQSLELLLEESLVKCARPFNLQTEPKGDDQFFVPDDAIDKLICRSRVSMEGEFPEGTMREILATRRRLFAILTRMNKTKTIAKFIDEGIDDNCLPFVFRDRRKMIVEYHAGSDTHGRPLLKALTCFDATPHGDEWRAPDIDTFCSHHQWHFLAPQLGVDCPCDGYMDSKVGPHRRFVRDVRIPFVENVDSSNGPDTTCLAGISRHKVKKAYVHPAHRNPCRKEAKGEPRCTASAYAVKLIHGDIRGQAAKNEINALLRFDQSGAQYRHRIIRLLCSFEYRSNYYLIFPYADANLWQFWKEKYPNVTGPERCLERGPSLARWMAGEMLGLVRGLRLIHDPPSSDNDNFLVNGKHGDLKPENILWFGNETDPYLITDNYRPPVGGILKISDFDTAEFHSDFSVSHGDARFLVKTDAYCAPESETGGRISQKYDSWSLGCVLLQFLTWYVFGFKGVNALDDAMMTTIWIRGQPVKLSRFFTVDSDTFPKTAHICPAVQDQIRTLRNHEDHTPFFEDVLVLIETRLLRIDPGERAATGELVDRLHDFYKKCLPSDGYCLPIQGKPPDSETKRPVPDALPSDPKLRRIYKPSWVRRLWDSVCGSLRRLRC
ncbi:kinase-like domain-containing protein [Podospora aff. communis PSN243]|uniref:Kinase-like domain-containing protein n=1 Tax=Podospora aff. communis PSN243 TaxID=3040156 RepID=A0AAV9GEC5_9PEZI|nr:kinase-like domain-containing protein [Podospora aff. communis PSN243]